MKRILRVTNTRLSNAHFCTRTLNFNWLTKDSIVVTCTITNTGTISGEEVVQLYIHDLIGSVTRPIKELKGFSKIMLHPGERKDVTFTIHNTDLAFYRKDMTFGTEPGWFEVYIGGNSRDLKSSKFELTGN